jgi:hypothetical protein
MADSTGRDRTTIARFEPEPPVIVFGRRIPFLYAEHRVDVAQQHLLKHMREENADFARLHHDFYDGRFRRMMLVISADSVRFAPSVVGGPGHPADPLTPQPQRLRATLQQTLDLMRQTLDAFDERDEAPLTVTETAALRQGIADIEPSVDPSDSHLAKTLLTLADRFGSGEPVDNVRPLHSGTPLHNLAHKLGLAH